MEIVNDSLIVCGADTPDYVLDHIKRSTNTERGIAVYWGQKEAEQLAELTKNIDVPSPMLRDYNWPGKHPPFAHQRTTSSFLSVHKRAFCFSEQGVGKTASAIWAADYLLNLGRIKRVLVICPLSIMKAAWQKDLFDFAMHRSCGVAYGSAEQRKKVIQSNAEFVIINYDGVGTVIEDIMAGGFDLIIIDEATHLKNVQTARWKTLNKIMKATEPRLWMLTGTPAAQSPLDAYGLAKLVNPDSCPRVFSVFRDKVMYQVTRFKWEPKRGYQDYLHRILQPAIRFEKKDCLDLPPVTHVERDAPLTPAQKKYYSRLQNEMIMEAAGETISAVNAAAKINKLLQISGGAVYTDDGQVVEFDVSNRIKTILEVIHEASHKVLVFVPFRHTIELLKETLERHDISCGVINGGVSLHKRTDLVERFQAQPEPQVMIIQPQAASHGLTLTAADTVVWYAPVTSVETYLQANARINRPGQNHPMTVVHVRGSEVENRLYTMLQNNIGNHEKLIDLYREVVSG